MQQGAPEEASNDQQHRAHRHFDSDQHRAQTARAAAFGRTLAVRTERLMQIGARDQPCRQRAEQRGSHNTGEHDEADYTCVNRDLAQARNVYRAEAHQPAHPEARQKNA